MQSPLIDPEFLGKDEALVEAGEDGLIMFEWIGLVAKLALQLLKDIGLSIFEMSRESYASAAPTDESGCNPASRSTEMT